jgi:mRNA interferase RelE/StbE
MTYELVWSDKSRRYLARLDAGLQSRIIGKAESIRGDPFRHVGRLVASGLYSLRIGGYRAIMAIDRGRLFIFVIEVGHRRGVYGE